MFTLKNRGSVGIFLTFVIAAILLVCGSGVISYKNGVSKGIADQIAIQKQGGEAVVNDSESLGGRSDTDSNVTVGKLTTGGTVYSTTTGSAATLREQDLLNNAVISVVAGNTTGVTLTLPATSTLTRYIPRAGRTATIYIQNDSTAATTTTIAAGTGITIDNASSTLAVAQGSSVGITFIRQANGDVRAFLTSYK